MRETTHTMALTRTIRLGGPIMVLAVALAACGGSSPSPSSGGEAQASSGAEESMGESMEPSVAESAEPTDGALDVGKAADSVSGLTSYQLDVTVESAGETQTITILATKSPVEASHYTMGGASPLDMIVIDGEGAWIKQGDTWSAPQGGTDLYLSVFDFFAPDRIVSTYRLGLYAANFAEQGSEERNGVSSTHFHLDASGISGPGSENFPDDGTFDLWVANDGGYLVSLVFGGTDPETGERSDLTMDVSRVNDPSISIEAPI